MSPILLPVQIATIILLLGKPPTSLAQGQFSQNGGQSFDFPRNDNNNCCEDYCYVTDEEPFINFATKTFYEGTGARRFESQHVVRECTPVQFVSLNRQGTSLPKASRIDKLRSLTKLHQQIIDNYTGRKSYPDKGRFCLDDFDLFKRWRWNDSITEDKAMSLTNQGMEDMRLLASRFQSKFSQLLPRNYDERAYYFQYTNSERTQDSYKAFTEGLFQSEAYRVHANTENDRLIKPFDNCKAWNDQVNSHPFTENEHNKFLQKPEYQQMVRDVFTRLGFRFNLNASIINDMYDMCRYEKAWNIQQRSAWCAAFTKKQLKLLEYAEDLKTFYENGYGNALSERIGCAPLKDIYQRLESTINGNGDGNKAAVFFTDSATILSVLTAMGVAKDYQKLTADNYYQQSKRKWQTSTLSPFAANIAAVLYECRGDEKHKVMFFSNEIPIDFPECHVGLCSWAVVQQKYQNLVENCNLENFCEGNSAPRYFSNHFLMLFAVVASLYYVKIV